ncbi:tyrosinase family oxidase copper chaperone [Streptomyces sp. NPDC005562]|uniref:tyrosinase family oxidase copper chaperone n=1 Tax=unclassified Streptomyces TaxID=2593676 RepID=UPI0033B6584D
MKQPITRRHLIGTAAAALLGAAGVVRSLPDPPEPEPPVPVPAVPGAPGPADGTPFDELYQGRRIQGGPAAAQEASAPGGWQVTVDGRPLGLMRRADGSYLSMVDHYESHPTPLAAARGAVDALGPLRALTGRGH